MSRPKFKVGDVVRAIRPADGNERTDGVSGVVKFVENSADSGHYKLYTVEFVKNVDGWGRKNRFWVCMGSELAMVKEKETEKKWKKAW